jgi:hypothetical protein
MVDSHGGDYIEALLFCRFEPHFAVDDLVAATDEDRLTEAKGADRAGNFAYVDGVETAKLSLCRPKLPQGHVRDGQERQQIVAERGRRRDGFGHSAEVIASATALPPQLVGQEEARRNSIGKVFQNLDS